MAGHSHRTSVKNGHKTFKSKHASKGALKRLYKGKVEKTIANGKMIKTITKFQRKNTAKQLRSKKISSTLEIRKLFEGKNGAEKIITVILLTEDISANDIISKLVKSDDIEIPEKDDSPLVNDVFITKYKTNLKFIVPDMSNFLNILDSAKVADFVVFGLSGTSEVDQEFGEQVIRALELQGISSYIGVVTNLSKVHKKEKFQLDVKQSLESYFKHFFPNEDHIFNLEKSSEALNALRFLCQRYPRPVSWRDNRGYLVAQKVDFVENNNDPNSENGNLVIEGTVRGVGFNADRLVHIPGLGDFQVNGIERILNSTRGPKPSTTTLDEVELLDAELSNKFEANQATRETLEEYALEDLDIEEWSDYDDDFEYENLTSARYDDHGFLPGRETAAKKVKLPKGTSEYQAKWYLDDVIDIDEDDEIEDHIGEEDLVEKLQTEYDEDMNMDTDDLASNHVAFSTTDAQTEAGDDDFIDLSPEEEERQWREFKAQESDDRDFPDEIELNPTESGIERMKRYRGLKNLHSCVWNYNEKDPYAPAEWKRILKIGDYKNIRNRLLKEAKKSAQVIAGDRIKIYIQFPKCLLEKITDPTQILVSVYSLLPHEHKNAMVNFSVERWEAYDEPVPSHEPLIVQYGVRRYTIQPLFSSASNSSNNVHKYERFLHHDTISIATCIAPVDFTQSPAIFFKSNPNDPKGLELVGQGSFLNADHTRILAKRAVLTGHPFRFHKNVVTVRYMFFNADDVEWFKSIPLFTKSGRSGFIKESLGTHGYFKASFDAKLSAQDIVGMALFKRMWPNTSLPWYGEE
ncbi:hypothetical protein TPHA_0B00800 [Tetrapisispora phaffii CBS 4417]|uniref:Bms1-type G domain-containing protein n=1 Tax=Tetrapisispora phaffii (strain ATCC 24235 / CBS 4417 / NBRC 1672 / NRRL Y-8282 / UCD 70-5) TaxID=1071381 RepID=G8BQF5_TETPH|nr:hypothetical protein TPHA_0B00800 [Tetrapisispora phaffii CBS 4417]CCE61752.1 hypothetical protein TPHA_0B00800 [Tetrapisispora phaffii CBS 4417]